MKRETLWKIFHAILTHLGKVEFRGTENLPVVGGLIVATNHMSRADTIHLFINPVRKDITALVADKYKKYPGFNWLLEAGKVIWLDRDKADFGALRVAAEWLNAGVCLGIAPEGTRSTDGQLQEGKAGIVLLANKTNVPIVPVGISGTDNYFRDLMHFRRPRVTLTYGPAFTLPPLDRSNRDESLKQLTDEVMVRIAVLLPPKHWGYYKDHPRLKELLAEKQEPKAAEILPS